MVDAVMKKGRVIHSSFFMMRVLPAPGPFRMAAISPVKAAHKAVDRNKMRRRVYAAVSVGKLKEGFHVALIARQTVLEADHSSLKADIEALFVKAGLLR
ncbi:MAG: ribonuclease P protein component [Patescibacteria group bacterium]|nr:ribonuclease P protein component [Patescibacteria group bacterium]